ncbi:hypothetical protein BZA05DRAFT_435740 [Tricharina praecox]|uniref:uncharacterized protein n=1 Tax=Tricharina praecox TaxID=43433 RepID=UPI00221EA6EB|nr:uncharacterized protein BZA05DRAFT_435740 [Tricharina praecox]KAI5853314.1 hypothetical protein BZA05DRAFT_435740 [Tricharina praecox]
MTRQNISTPPESIASSSGYSTPTRSEYSYDHGYDSENGILTPRTMSPPPTPTRQRNGPVEVTGLAEGTRRATTRWSRSRIIFALGFLLLAIAAELKWECVFSHGHTLIVEPSVADFPALTNMQVRLCSMMENSVGGIVTSHKLKQSEIAVRQLHTLVKMSRLGGREDLSNRLADFADAARDSSKEIARFSHTSISLLHDISDLDVQVVRQLEHLQAERIAAEPYSDMYRLLVSPFKPLPSHDLAAAEQAISDMFIRSSDAIGSSIARLLVNTVMAVEGLNDMEKKLLVIFEAAQRESMVIDDADEYQGAWDWLVKFLSDHKVVTEENRHLLRGLSGYHSEAVALVTRTLAQLQYVEESLKNLRDRMAEPALLAAAEYEREQLSIPLDEQIKSIRSAVDTMGTILGKAAIRDRRYMEAILSGDL